MALRNDICSNISHLGNSAGRGGFRFFFFFLLPLVQSQDLYLSC